MSALPPSLHAELVERLEGELERRLLDPDPALTDLAVMWR